MSHTRRAMAGGSWHAGTHSGLGPSTNEIYPKYGLGDVDLNVPFRCCAKIPDEHMHIKPIVPPYEDTW